MNLQVVFFNDGVRPHTAHDLVFRHQRAIGSYQQFQNLECTAADTQRFAVRADLAIAERDLKMSDLDHGLPSLNALTILTITGNGRLAYACYAIESKHADDLVLCA